MKPNPDPRIQTLAALVSGLLATGHYTEHDQNGRPCLIRCDNGKDWKVNSHKSRFTLPVIEDAELLLDSIETTAEQYAEFDRMIDKDKG